MITFFQERGKRAAVEVYTCYYSKKVSKGFYVSYLGVYAWIGINFVLGRDLTMKMVMILSS